LSFTVTSNVFPSAISPVGWFQAAWNRLVSIPTYPANAESPEPAPSGPVPRACPPGSVDAWPCDWFPLFLTPSACAALDPGDALGVSFFSDLTGDDFGAGDTLLFGFSFSLSSSSSFDFCFSLVFCFNSSSLFFGEDLGVAEWAGDGLGVAFGVGLTVGLGVAFGVGLGVGFGVGLGDCSTVGRAVGVAAGVGCGLGVEIGSSEGGATGGGVEGAGGGVGVGDSSSWAVSGCLSWPSSGRDCSLGSVEGSGEEAACDSAAAESPPNDPGFIQTTASLLVFDWDSDASNSPPSRTTWTAAMATKVFLKPPSGSSLR